MKEIMGKVLVVFVFFTGTFTLVNAQTATEANEKFSEGAEAMNAGNTQEAIAAFEETIQLAENAGPDAEGRAIEAKSYLPNLYYRLTMDEYRAKDYDGAIETAKKTVDVAQKYNDPGTEEKAKSILPKLHYAKAVQFYKAKDFAAAVPIFKEAVALDPEYATAYFSLAIAQKNLGNDDEMVKNLEKVIEIGPSSNQTVKKAEGIVLNHYLNQGKLAINEKRYQNAVETFEASLVYDDTDADVYYYIALASNALENWDKAIEFGKKAIEYEKGGEEKVAGIYYEIAKAYAGKGDNTNACDAYSKAAVGRFEESANYQMEHVLDCEN